MNPAVTTDTKRPLIGSLIRMLLLLFLLQLLHTGICYVIFLFIPRTNLADRAASLSAMLLMLPLLLLFAKKKEVPLSFLPSSFSKPYLAASLAYVLLLISTPVITKTCSPSSLLLLLYGSLVTPLYEELIFRGLIWNCIRRHCRNEFLTFLLVTILFGLWHLGYIYALAFRVHHGLLTAMFFKMVTGLCYGAVLGALRLHTGNCYSTLLLHGMLNIFGR